MNPIPIILKRRRGGAIVEPDSGGSSDPSFPGTLLQSLWDQPNNRSTNIKIKVAPVANTNSNWSASLAYTRGDMRIYPSDSGVMWVAKENVGSGEAPPTSNSKWDLGTALWMAQDSGDGVHYFLTTLQRQSDGWVRANGFSYGTIEPASYTFGSSNYNDNALTNQTSASSVSVPTTHPSSRSWTTATGLSIPNSATIGTCTDSFAIPTTTGTAMSRNLPTGLSVVAGDTITFYGDASNFFVCVVARYNSATGEFYGFSVRSVGTGTFASWTLKTERLVYCFQTGGETTRSVLGLCQTYDSGTGVLTVNSVSHVGSGSTSSWTIVQKALQPQSVPASQTSNFNQTNLPLGNWILGSINGTGLNHRCQVDNRGTGWKYIYVSGPNDANPPADSTIDTYNASLLTSQQKTVWEDLLEGEHFFIAVSVTSPSGLSANSRAWVTASSNPAEVNSFGGIWNYEAFSTTINVALNGSQSLGETVFIFRPPAEETVRTWPWHGNPTDLNEVRQFIVDGVEIDGTVLDGVVNPYLRNFQPFTTAEVIQSGKIIHPDYPAYGNFVQYDSKHTLDKNGFTLNYLRMELLQEMFVQQWYCNLFAMQDDWIFPGRVIAQDGEVIEWPSSGTVSMSATFKGQNGYMFESDNHPDYLLADYWPDTTNWRIGEPQRGPDHIENLPGDSSKFRPYPSFERTFPAGTIYTIQNRKYFGNRGTIP